MDDAIHSQNLKYVLSDVLHWVCRVDVKIFQEIGSLSDTCENSQGFSVFSLNGSKCVIHLLCKKVADGKNILKKLFIRLQSI